MFYFYLKVLLLHSILSYYKNLLKNRVNDRNDPFSSIERSTIFIQLTFLSFS